MSMVQFYSSVSLLQPCVFYCSIATPAHLTLPTNSHVLECCTTTTFPKSVTPVLSHLHSCGRCVSLICARMKWQGRSWQRFLQLDLSASPPRKGHHVTLILAEVSSLSVSIMQVVLVLWRKTTSSELRPGRSVCFIQGTSEVDVKTER